MTRPPIPPAAIMGPMAEPWFRKLDSFADEAEADREFWAQMTPNERVAVIDDLRRTWLKMKGLPDERLRRVVRVLKQERS